MAFGNSPSVYDKKKKKNSQKIVGKRELLKQ